jgi:diaminobutyrate-2-oxoglutarate transaminase
MAMAAGTATLKYIKENNLSQHAKELGEKLMLELSILQNEIPEIGDVRGRGLMVGAEIVNPKIPSGQKGTFAANPKLASRIQRECFNRGLILEVGGRHGSVIRFLPPLIITEEQLDDVIAIFKDAVRAALK